MLLAPWDRRDTSIFPTGIMDLDEKDATRRLRFSQNGPTWMSVQPFAGFSVSDRGDLSRPNPNALHPTAKRRIRPSMPASGHR